jgi:hypothetical protein
VAGVGVKLTVPIPVIVLSIGELGPRVMMSADAGELSAPSNMTAPKTKADEHFRMNLSF